ncbi:uncharacterized protein LOC126474244 [Schistocerca serialis cubense]|uniref:uncharacterized protein LOC126474244 n=1 Tax=Schistocerca serialis cubense TaxID=2023355 RepID=UPI00214E7EE6|nr:uncharacterized protein LOC126474244 [Schistocerca serialis cubense]
MITIIHFAQLHLNVLTKLYSLFISTHIAPFPQVNTLPISCCFGWYLAVSQELSKSLHQYFVSKGIRGSAEWFTWPGGSQAAPVDKKGPFTCPVCLRIYRRSRSLWRHQRYECNMPAQFLCPLCPYRAKHKCSLKLHLNKKHHMPSENTTDVNYLQK